MRITRIELAGTLTGNGKGIPQAFACLHRRLGDDHITVELITPAGDETHQVKLGDPVGIETMAAYLQATLDNCLGSAARRKFQVRQYVKVLNRLV